MRCRVAAGSAAGGDAGQPIVLDVALAFPLDQRDELGCRDHGAPSWRAVPRLLSLVLILDDIDVCQYHFGMKRLIDPDALLLQGAADPTRLAILRQLAGGDGVCACDFTACCDVAQPTVSHHLKVLREAGWVRSERARVVRLLLAPARGRRALPRDRRGAPALDRHGVPWLTRAGRATGGSSSPWAPTRWSCSPCSGLGSRWASITGGQVFADAWAWLNGLEPIARIAAWILFLPIAVGCGRGTPGSRRRPGRRRRGPHRLDAGRRRESRPQRQATLNGAAPRTRPAAQRDRAVVPLRAGGGSRS